MLRTMAPSTIPSKRPRHATSLSVSIPSHPTATNTLIITNVAPSAFSPENLSYIHSLLEASAGSLTSFAPLKSLRRIIVSFPTAVAAATARRELDGRVFAGESIRCYYGTETNLEGTKKLLKPIEAPKKAETERLSLSPPESPVVENTRRRSCSITLLEQDGAYPGIEVEEI